MTFKDRLKVFLIGAVLGVVLVTYIKNKKAENRPVASVPVTAEEMQQAAAPGIYQAYAERGAPMQSDFIKASRLYPHPDNDKYIRVLILKGEEPGQVLRIEETVIKTKPAESIDQVKVMAADRVIVLLTPGMETAQLAQQLKPWGYRIIKRGEATDQYIIELGAREPETVSDAIERISAVEGVGKVEPLVYGR